MKYLTGTQVNMESASVKIWYNFLMQHANNDDKLVGDGETHYYLSNLQAMEEAQVSKLKAYGSRLGVVQKNSGFTTSYALPRKAANNASLYTFSKPSDSRLMNGVINVNDEDFNPDWLPSED